MGIGLVIPNLDKISNLKRGDGIEYTWTNAQKLESVQILSDYSLTFKYDAMQNRVAKYENGFGWHKYQYYIRDAQGNVMATYKLWKHSSGGVTYLDSVKLMEQHIYGSARVGMVAPELMLYPVVPTNPHALDSCRYRIFEGWKRYEITNHLGNVLVVITDRKRGQGSSGDIEWFAADVLATQQYYPFGMLMPGDTSANVRRQYSLNTYDYRYGFNGKEGDDEVKGDDNQQDYGMRIYDPRVARFLSVDPIAREYPWYTPYQFAGNMPIWAVDLDGKEPKPMFQSDERVGYAVLVTVDPNYIGQLTAALSQQNINVGLNILKQDPNNLNIYLVEQQFYQGYSTRSPNISSQLLGIQRPRIAALQRLPQRQPEITGPQRLPELPNVPIIIPPPPPPPPPPLRIGFATPIRSDIGVVPATPGRPAQFPLNGINLRTLNRVGRLMRATELAASISRFDIIITVQTGSMAPSAATNMINSVRAVAGQIIAGFRTTSSVVSPINITVNSTPTTPTTLSVTPR